MYSILLKNDTATFGFHVATFCACRSMHACVCFHTLFPRTVFVAATVPSWLSMVCGPNRVARFINVYEVCMRSYARAPKGETPVDCRQKMLYEKKAFIIKRAQEKCESCDITNANLIWQFAKVRKSSINHFLQRVNGYFCQLNIIVLYETAFFSLLGWLLFSIIMKENINFFAIGVLSNKNFCVCIPRTQKT